MSHPLRVLPFLVIAFAASQIFAQGVDHFVKNDEFDDGSLEKARNEFWYNIRTSGEEKDLAKIELNAFNEMRSMQNRASFKSLNDPAWQQVAGSQDGHNSGRIVDIAVDPNNPNVVYIASATGGVWKTDNITSSPVHWVSLSDRLPTLNCGAIAFSPPSTLILGTGESVGDGIYMAPGQGIFKSTDGGNNWTQVSNLGGEYSQIVIDPLNPQVVYAAYNSASWPPPTASSMVKSTDGGNTWRKLGLNISGPLSIGYNPQHPLVLVVGGYGSIFRSLDSGATWKKSVSGLSGTLSRISIANAPSNPDLFYASVGTGTGGYGDYNTINGVFKSDNAGATWQTMMKYDPLQPGGSTNVNPLGGQQSWCNAIAVNPADPKQVFVAGLDIYSSADSGITWQENSVWYKFSSDYTPFYAHADHHRLLFSGNTLYDCSDGGLAKSTAPFTQWNSDVNLGLATLLFVNVDADEPFTFVSGGCQDNGVNRAPLNSAEFTETRGGDGGRTIIAPDDASLVYTTYVYSTFYGSDDSGKSYGDINLLQQNVDLYIDAFSGTGTGEGCPFYPAYDVSREGSVIALGGNSHMWTSINQGDDNFTAVPPSNDTKTGRVNVVHLWQGEDYTGYMWAGSAKSVWRSIDQGVTWASTSIGEQAEGITTNPKNHDEVFVVTQGVGTGQKHFFKSTDGGATFTNPATNFPNIGCWSIAYDPNDGNLYVGTDKGVVYSYDNGVTWNPLMNGMPMAEIHSLTIKGAASDKLLAGTYGRGVFWIDASQLKGVNTSKDISQFLSLEPVNPNPITASNAAINFMVKDNGLATLILYDILGRELRTLEKSFVEPGRHQVTFSTSGLASDTYFVRLTQNGRSVSEKIVIN